MYQIQKLEYLILVKEMQEWMYSHAVCNTMDLRLLVLYCFVCFFLPVISALSLHNTKNSGLKTSLTQYTHAKVMKMYIPLVAPESGKIRVVVPEGAVLQAGDVVANLELDEPDR